MDMGMYIYLLALIVIFPAIAGSIAVLMIYKIAAHSDVGIVKKTNQDSVLVKIAQTNHDKVCLCVVCDGMGGLADGELASATVIREFDQWFINKLPGLLETPEFPMDELRVQWDDLVMRQNKKLAKYASGIGTRMGTTVVAFLVVDDKYYIMNIGDSRAYMVSDAIYQLTKDQTYVQYEMDLGHLTWEQAQTHPQRNVLLQCVGASDEIHPDYFVGDANPDTTFILCSDGFRHVISPDEIYEKFRPELLENEDIMLQNIVSLVELNKSRKEVDNISAAVIRTCREG